jgi:type I restriction enzyme R subunit
LRESKGTDEGKVFNLVRGLQDEIDEDPNNAPVLQPLKERAERILKDLESRKTTGLAAIDLLGAIAAEKEALIAEAKASGLSPQAFGIMSALRADPALKAAGIDAKEIADQLDALRTRLPNASVNEDERRRLRAALYLPLLDLPQRDSARIVDLIMRTLLP